MSTTTSTSARWTDTFTRDRRFWIVAGGIVVALVAAITWAGLASRPSSAEDRAFRLSMCATLVDGANVIPDVRDQFRKYNCGEFVTTGELASQLAPRIG